MPFSSIPDHILTLIHQNIPLYKLFYSVHTISIAHPDITLTVLSLEPDFSPWKGLTIVAAAAAAAGGQRVS
jgi:hypothetical protein